MMQLSFGCYCSELKVRPKEWSKPSIQETNDWYIYYRFYDPVFVHNPKYKKGKLIIIKGMNHLRVHADKRALTERLIEDELYKLQERGYNPITGKFLCVTPAANHIESSTFFIDALKKSPEWIQVAPLTKRDIDGVIKLVEAAAIQLGFAQLPISRISRRHIKIIFSQIEANLGSKSAHRYNKLRSYLMILFNELMELEATEVNPLKLIAKKKTIKKLRKTLSSKSRQLLTFILKNIITDSGCLYICSFTPEPGFLS
jgi:hypothetical protein